MTNLAIRIQVAMLSAFQSAVEAVKRERGQDLIEYAMLGGLIALSILAVAFFFTGAIENMIQGIGNCIDFDNATSCDAGF